MSFSFRPHVTHVAVNRISVTSMVRVKLDFNGVIQVLVTVKMRAVAEVVSPYLMD